jgi:hypothetical protein
MMSTNDIYLTVTVFSVAVLIVCVYRFIVLLFEDPWDGNDDD